MVVGANFASLSCSVLELKPDAGQRQAVVDNRSAGIPIHVIAGGRPGVPIEVAWPAGRVLHVVGLIVIDGVEDAAPADRNLYDIILPQLP